MVFLFTGFLAAFVVQTDITPLLPIYTIEKCANSAAAGFYLSFAFLCLATGMMYFCLGVVTSVMNILAGLFVPDHERGKVFGILGTTQGIGGIIGGLVVGPLVDRCRRVTCF
jgi:MFS family permease